MKKNSLVFVAFVIAFGMVWLAMQLVDKSKDVSTSPLPPGLQSAGATDVVHGHPAVYEEIQQALTDSATLEQSQLYDRAEPIYIRVLANSQLEDHDPMRVIVLQRYGKLLVLLKRQAEAEAMFAEAKRISFRRKIDKHPARAHVS